MIPLLALAFTPLLSFLAWGALCVMSTWAWRRGKTAASLLTLIGALLLAVDSFFDGFGILFNDAHWIPLVGSILVAVGYYLTVKPIVDAKIREIKAKRQAMAPPGSVMRPPSAP